MSADSDWLTPYLPCFPPGVRALDLGCGPGEDSAALQAHGVQVVSCDRAPRALLAARGLLGSGALLRVDHTATLPFRDAAFDAVLASLSLHYFPWAITRATFAEVRRVLKPGAPFLFRVNAHDDVEFGARDGVEVEPGLRTSDESPYSEVKRFFDGPSVRAAVEPCFIVESLRHTEIDRLAKPKRFWECLARAV